MPISSYQTQNSYDELNLKPFQLDYSSLLKEASAKTSYWMEGAAKIQQAYSKITGLAPQFIKNKEALNQFNNQVKDKIKKLAGTDLGIQGNANMINDVIAPLYDTSNETSEAILLDDSYNKAGQNLLKTIEGYKTKDKGIGYSSNNEKYATEWYQEYLEKATKSKDPLNDLRSLRSKVKQYTPYYDYNKEMETAIAKCPENSSSQDSIKNSYNITVSSASKQVGPCIQSFLSDKAKSQMQIDGYVGYGKNYSALGNDILELNKPTIDSYSKSLGLIALKLQDSKITPEEKEAYLQQKGEIQSELKKLNSLNSKISQGDYTDIANNYEQYAGIAHMSNKIASLNKAFSYTKDKTEIEADMVSLTYDKLKAEAVENERQRVFDAQQNVYKEGNANYRAELNEEGANIRAGLTAEGKQKQPLPESLSYEAADGTQDIVMDKNRFVTQGKSIIEDMWKAETDMANYIFSKYGRNSGVNIQNKKEAETYIRGLIATDPLVQQDPTVKIMLDNVENRRLNYNLWNSENKRIEQKIAKTLKNDQQPIIVESVNGTKYNVRPENFKKNLNFVFSSAGVSGWVNITDAKGNVIRKEPIKNAVNIYDKTKVVDKIETDYYKTAVTPQSLWVSNENRNVAKQDKNPDPIRQRLSTILGGLPADEEGKKNITYDDIKIGRNNLDGDVEIILPQVNGSTVNNTNAVLDILRANFKAKDFRNMGGGKFKLIGTQEFKDASSNDSYLEQSIVRIMNSINETDYNIQEEIPILNNYKNRFEVYTKKATPGLIYMYDKTIPNSTIVTTTNISELVAQLKQAK